MYLSAFLEESIITCSGIQVSRKTTAIKMGTEINSTKKSRSSPYWVSALLISMRITLNGLSLISNWTPLFLFTTVGGETHA